MSVKQDLLRKLPAISVILEHESVRNMADIYPHSILAEAASEVVQGIRSAVLEGSEQIPDNLEAIIKLVALRIEEKTRPKLRKVINATGIVLHTNLGRAVLSEAAVKAIHEVAGNYSNLELDLATGERGSRYSHVEELLCSLTGAEAGLVVNNNAAAVLLVLNTLADGKEVIVSRGQLVEIGGSFRIPDVMTQSGAVLVEVGTTNKTHLRDYENAVTDQTALLLKVHTSNYKIIGFTKEVPVHDLAKVGRANNIPVYEDLGSGVLVDFVKYGITHEPTVRESISAGADVVTCSGDKLFGGPQAGIIVGSAELINKMKKNPLTRALRIDKFTLAAMEATLRLYFDENRAVKEIPTLKMITMPLDEIKVLAEQLTARIIDECGAAVNVDIEEGYSQVGGGALPEENIRTYLVALSPQDLSVNAVEEKMRAMEPPILCRIQKDRLLFDPRTLFAGDAEVIASHLKKILERVNSDQKR